VEAVDLYTRWNWAGALLFTTDAGANEDLLADVGAYRGPLDLRVGFWADHRGAGNLDAFRAMLPGLAALKIHTSFTRTAADDPAWQPYYETARAAELPVIVHCGRWKEIAGFEHALSAASAFSDLRFVLSHMGGDSPVLVQAAVRAVMDQRLDNVYLGTESIREPWLLELALARVGAGRIVFGSDYNLNHPETFRRQIELLDVSDRDRQRIMRGNINDLMPACRKFFD